jgi:putative membrane-bound dehydrogenase-like protein
VLVAVQTAKQNGTELYFYPDADGDLKSEKPVLIAANYGGPGNPEHTANGLIYGLDNWIYSADCGSRFRPSYSGPATDAMPGVPAPTLQEAAEGWRRQKTNSRGQWGISQDDIGRLYYNTNSDVLRCDLVPTHYLSRNANFRGDNGVNYRVVKDQATYPCRITPGVNRGYRSGQLRKDGTLATVTAACGVGVYRGDQYPAEFLNNIFVPEPSGNLIKRVLPEADGLLLQGNNPYKDAEFLASHDERFRPVNTYTGPDGTLYVCDLYRGILQHRAYVTSYLKAQILDRGLDKPLGLGRVYRLVHTAGKPIGPKPQMSKESAEQLVAHLSHPNGWWRDTAQRLLIERGDDSAVPALQKTIAAGTSPLGKIHALWTLEGLNKLDVDTVLAGMSDADARVRAAAVRVSEGLLGGKDKKKLVPKLAALAQDADEAVRLQVAYSIVEAQHPKVDETLEALLLDSRCDSFVEEAVVSGLGARELDFMEALLKKPEWAAPKGQAAQAISDLASCVFIESQPTKIIRMIDLAASAPSDELRMALIDGMLNGKLPGMKNPRTAKLPTEPAALKKLDELKDKKVAGKVKSLRGILSWPDKPGVVVKLAPPLTETQQVLFTEGKENFLKTCATCHQPHGLGEAGKAPPLLDSDWVLGTEQRLIRIALHGVRGPIMVNGSAFNMEMPAVQGMDDKMIAGILTYMRREWGHQGTAIEPDLVAKVRAAEKEREEQWTEKELLKVK